MRVPFLILSLLLVTAVLATAWEPPPCPPETVAAWSRFREEMMKVDERSPTFLPHPYTEKEDEILANLAFSLRRRYGTDPARAPELDRPVMEGLAANRLQYQIVQVEDWTSSRCSRGQDRRRYTVVRVFDRRHGGEIARYSMRPSGLLATWVVFADYPPDRLTYARAAFPDAESTRLQARALLDTPEPTVRLVQLTGDWELYCPEIAPCAVVTSADRTLLVGTLMRMDGVLGVAETVEAYGRPVFEFEPDRRLTELLELAPSDRLAQARSLRDLDRERLLVLDDEMFFIVDRLGQTFFR